MACCLTTSMKFKQLKHLVFDTVTLHCCRVLILANVGLKHKEPPPAKDDTAEKQCAKMSDDRTLLLMDQMDQTDTIWCPTDTRRT